MKAVESLKRDDAIYLAGLFDGEGCAQFKRRMETKRKGKRYNCMIISLELSMTDEKTVRHIHDKVKVGTVLRSRGTQFCRTCTPISVNFKFYFMFNTHNDL